jgi:hypothetical protein
VSEDNEISWAHESFIRGNPEMISNMVRTRIKRNGVPQSTGKPEEARSHSFQQLPSVDSSEQMSECYEKGTDYEDGSCIYDNARQISNIRIRHAVPASFKDELFDNELNALFSERASSQDCGYAQINNVDQMDLEPLPVHSVGILDEPGNRRNSELAEFGQLLDHLMSESSSQDTLSTEVSNYQCSNTFELMMNKKGKGI